MWPFKRKPKAPTHRHTWFYVSVVRGERRGTGPVTFVSRVCTTCNRLDSEEWRGHWNLEVLNHDWVANPPERKS